MMISVNDYFHGSIQEVFLRRFVILWALCMLLLTSCAYYNTFYNAKKEFKNAEESLAAKPPVAGPSSSQRELYEKAIKKASKVLAFYPNSKYVDDALFMMGKAYFRMEEYGKARRKFEELLANYPQSKFRWEARYMLGTIHYYLDDTARARDALTVLIDAKKKSQWIDDSLFLLGEMAYYAGDYMAAVEEFTKIPEDFPKSELRADAMFMTGECYFNLKNYREALTFYQKARAYEVQGERRYQIELRIGECHQRLREYPEALETFEALASSDRYVDKLPETRLRISEVHYLMGDTAKAVQEYESIIKKNPKTKEAAWAYYQLGMIHMEDLDNLATAEDYFDKSKSELPASEASGLASLRRNQINKLKESRQKVADMDSVPDPDALFSLAEIYLLDLNRPDSAMTYYQKVVELTPLSMRAAPSAYAAAWIVENILGDTVKSRNMYEHLIATYPYSQGANAARERLGQSTVLDPLEENAARRFQRAEELLLKENDVDGALSQYQSIVTDFPRSPYAPKAECAIAWTLEYIKGDPDSALVLFKLLAQKYPNSECATLAERKIAPPRPAEAPKDSTAQPSVSEEGAEQKAEESPQKGEEEGEKKMGEPESRRRARREKRGDQEDQGDQ
jgi:TolA-binding protein